VERYYLHPNEKDYGIKLYAFENTVLTEMREIPYTLTIQREVKINGETVNKEIVHKGFIPLTNRVTKKIVSKPYQPQYPVFEK
ncbi:unnamed protein product, partial [marine sediment metagenome]